MGGVGVGGGGGGGGPIGAGESQNSMISLSILNSTVRYNIKDELKLFFGDENDENIFLSDSINHIPTTSHITINRKNVFSLA